MSNFRQENSPREEHFPMCPEMASGLCKRGMIVVFLYQRLCMGMPAQYFVLRRLNCEIR